ncbi:zinc finger protein ZAT9-like [Cicer arietinum]|uniref:Zinc finger protein ZAT9-like n=1 Tax=Cicer arietinum TaxID=3827 RepID=A0A1S2XU53_CICAR|nr:zinc finger protein ZAT9-like [Cicer arietinum]
MDKYNCKLCYRSFSNGRALGGHMRSHMMNLIVNKQEEKSSRTIQLSFEAESAPSSTSEEDNDCYEKDLCYPKRNIPHINQDFTIDNDSILPDRESETESSKNNPTRKRSKRLWKIRGFDPNYYDESVMKKVKFCNKTESSVVEYEPASSVSNATTDEDVAFCLMLLSRDKWNKEGDYNEEDEIDDEVDEDPEEEEDEEEDKIERSLEESDESQEQIKVIKNNKLRKGRYKCETCNKVFKSYQALGGHRASHKKIKLMNINVEESPPEFESGIVEKKIHECPVCFRVFSSGQALGGHKRTHVIHGSSTTTTTVPILSSTKIGKSVIDLNLPAPIDDDDVSQIENSAVSDAEFVKTR